MSWCFFRFLRFLMFLWAIRTVSLTRPLRSPRSMQGVHGVRCRWSTKNMNTTMESTNSSNMTSLRGRLPRKTTAFRLSRFRFILLFVVVSFSRSGEEGDSWPKPCRDQRTGESQVALLRYRRIHMMHPLVSVKWCGRLVTSALLLDTISIY